MKIVPVSMPSIPQPTGANVQYQQSAKEKAIAMLSTPQSQQHPVQNPSQISPEETGALRQTSNNKGHPNLNSETPKEDTKASTISEEPLSSSYANLARKERALRQRAAAQAAELKVQQAAIKAQEEALKVKEAEYQTKYIPKDRLTNDTLNALLEAGLTYDQITEAMLAQQGQPDFSKSPAYLQMQAELKSLKDAQENTRKSIEDQQTQSYQQALKQIDRDARDLIYTNSEFEAIRSEKAAGQVVKLIERTFNEEGRIMSVDEAASEVENFLVDKAIRSSSLKKVQQRLKSKETAPETQQKTTDAPKQQQLKTLSNSVSSTRQLSAKERALLAFRGELNK